MLRVATYNLNGVRAAVRRGLDDWLTHRGCDVVALQEVRCPVEALPAGVFARHHLTYDAGTVAGRNGVAVLTHAPPAAVRTWGAAVLRRAPGDDATVTLTDADPAIVARGLGRFAHEGRYVEVDLADVPLTVASLYLPKGGLPAHLQRPGSIREPPDDGAKHARKMAFLAAFARHLTRARRSARAEGREFLLLGDLNLAPAPPDVTRWRPAQRMEGFLPEERAWFAANTGPRRLVDVVRALRPDEVGPMSWWSWLGESFENDVGWRIDHHLATPRLARVARDTRTDREPDRERRRSDHAAVVVDYDLDALASSG